MPRVEKIAMGCKPDPYKFTIVDIEYYKGFTIIMANYEGCKTFDGNKLMVLNYLAQPDELTTLDPHFIEGHSVVARFTPDEMGKRMAYECIEAYNIPD